MSNLPSVPNGVPSLGSALAAAENAAQNGPGGLPIDPNAAANAAAQAQALAKQSAQAYAQSALGPYVAPGVVQAVGAGNFDAAVEAELASLAGQLGTAVEGLDAFKVLAADVIEGEKMTAAAVAAIVASLPIIAAIAGESVAGFVVGALVSLGFIPAAAAATGAAIGSAVPIAGTIIGAFVGVVVGLVEGIAHDFPCGTEVLNNSLYYAKFSSKSELQAGDNCGMAKAAFGSGNASGDEIQERQQTVRDLVLGARDKILAVPNWPQSFLATYAHLAAGANGDGADGWTYDPVEGHAPRFADQIFDLVADAFASWWIQQPGWLGALASLPEHLPSIGIPYGMNVFDTVHPELVMGPTGHYHEWANVPQTVGQLAVELGSKPPDLSHMPFSNPRKMLLDRIGYAIESAVLGTHAIAPNATRADYDAARAAVVTAGRAIGGSIEAGLLLRQSEVGAQLGFELDDDFRQIPVYGFPGDRLGPRAVPLPRPLFALDRFLGGSGAGAPSPAHIRAVSQATVDAAVPEAYPSLNRPALGGALTTALGGAAGLARMRATRAIAVAGQPSVSLDVAGVITRAAASGDPNARRWIHATGASAQSGHPVGRGNAEVLTLARKLAILETFVDRYVGAAAARAVATGLHLAS